jgi:transposase
MERSRRTAQLWPPHSSHLRIQAASVRLPGFRSPTALSGEAFERGRDFGAWLGLVPRQYSTGGKSILGRISKRGSRCLRTLFIQAANVILMRPQTWEGSASEPG